MTTTSGARTTFEGRTRLFGSLCGLVFLVNLSRVVFAPLLEPLMASFDFGTDVAGLIAMLVWVGSALLRIPTGILLTRVPRHHVILGAGLVVATAAAFTAAADSVFLLGTGALLMGLASGAYFIAANPIVAELYPRRVGRAIGVHGTAMQSAAVVAPLFVGAVLAVGDWRGVFVAMSAAALGVTAILFVAARRAELPDAGREDRDFLGAARRQWPIILSAIVLMGVTGFAWQGLFNFYVTYLKVGKGLPEATARNLLTVVFAAGVPAFFLTGRLADRVPNVPLLLSLMTGFVACTLGLTVVTGLPGLVLVTAALGYVVHSQFAALDAYLLGTFPDDNRASAYAVYSGGMMVVQASGSWVVGWLAAAGVPFDGIFRTLAVGVGLVLTGMVALQATDRFPGGRDPTTTR